MTIRIAQFDPHTASDELWAAFNETRRAIAREVWPDEPILDDAETRREVLHQQVERARHLANGADGDAGVERRRVELLVSEQNLNDPDIGLLLQEMGGKAVPQRVNTDTFGNAGTSRCQANDPVQLARTGMLPAVARKQPGLTGDIHPFLRATRHHSRNSSRSWARE
jgi:hypothetical protein